MGYHKGSFYILRVDGTVELKTGWIDETNTFGFYQLKRTAKGSGNKYTWKWIATDIASGLRITNAKTRAACSEWIDANMAHIKEQMSKPEYFLAIKERERRLANGKVYKTLAG